VDPASRDTARHRDTSAGENAIADSTTAVSIVIPSYNRADALRQTLPSVFAVRGVDEIILVDDASTDDTQEFLATLDEPRLRVILQPENQGVQAARNMGMSAASGEWVIFGEDDVWFPDDYAEVMLRVAAEQDADIVGSPWLLIEDGDIEGAVARARDNAVEHVGLDQVSTFPLRTIETPFLPALILVRRSISDALQYDSRYGGNAYREETDFFVRAARAGFKVVLTPDTFQYQLRRWGGGVSNGRFAHEYWAIRNTNRFLREHGHWLHKNGYCGRPLPMAVRFAFGRVRYHVAPRTRRLFVRSGRR
jgi:GT2 family glycosyltransferase